MDYSWEKAKKIPVPEEYKVLGDWWIRKIQFALLYAQALPEGKFKDYLLAHPASIVKWSDNNDHDYPIIDFWMHTPVYKEGDFDDIPGTPVPVVLR